MALIEGTEHAAVVVPRGDGTLQALAAHGGLPPLIMAAQNELGVGPCLDAVAGTEQLLVCDLGTDTRWSAFGARTRRWNLSSML